MQKIKEAEKKALSNIDILNAVNNKCNLVTYSDIQHYRNIDDLLGPYHCCVILYESDGDCGHWCVLQRRKDGKLEFFDPYGIPIDDKIKWNTENVYCPELTKLIVDNKESLVYNDQPLQKMKKNINTCGRHVISRILNRNMDIDEYCDVVTNFKPWAADDVVTYLTLNI